MKIKGLLIVFACLLSFHSLLFSQESVSFFDHFSVKEGLSQNSIMAIHKDTEGFMWFGTKDGLNKFDGYQFTTYRHNLYDDNSLSGNFVKTITEDRDGILWIGTDNGLCSFDKSTQKFTVYRHDSNLAYSISHNNVLSIVCRQNGDLWIGTEHGLNLLKKGTKVFKRYFKNETASNTLKDDHINTIFEDDQNTLWIGTRNKGLHKLINPNQPAFKIVEYANKTISTLSKDVKSILKVNKSLWVGTANGVYSLNNNGTLSEYPKINQMLSSNIVRTIIADEKQNLWIGTYNGLNYLDLKTQKVTIFKNEPTDEGSLSHNSIRSLYIDQSNILWVGTFFGGLNILRTNAIQFRYFKSNPLINNTLSYDVISEMTEDQNGNIWIATEGGGLNFYSYQKKSFEHINRFGGKNINDKTIKSVLLDSKGNLWLGTHLNGLLKLDFRKNKLFNYILNEEESLSTGQKSITELHEDEHGIIWVGTNKGLFTFNPSTLKKEKIGLTVNDPIISSIYQDLNKNLWLGTKKNGLITYNNSIKQHYVTNKNNKSSIGSNAINCIFEDSKKRLWIGTDGGGLNRFKSENQSFIRYTVKDGLVNNIVHGIEEDNDEKLWVSTSGGLSKFNPNSGYFRNYNSTDEIPISDFNEDAVLKHSSGQLFFGGFNGLLSFWPKQMMDSPITPQVMFTGLKLFNKDVIPNDETGLLTASINNTQQIKFTHKQNIFTIDFIGLNYEQFGQNQYAYILEGLESDWNYVGDKTSATYTNLSPGDYIFKVKAGNTDGVWGQDVLSINITKLPPFWKTSWAYLIYSFVAVLLFFLIRKYFLIKLNLENRLKLQRLEKEQIENLTKLKLKFFTNISHDFRTPLTLIHGPLQELKSKMGTSEMNGHINLISKNVNLMLRLINQLMDFRKLNSGNLSLNVQFEPLVPFIREVALSFKEHSKKSAINFTVNTQLGNDNFWFDKDKIEKILYNLLSNAFKHTPKHGNVAISVSTTGNDDNKTIQIKVNNTGHGIEKEDIDKIFNRFYQSKNEKEYSTMGTGIGLSFVQDMVKLHKGEITLKSELDKYTEFTISIPGYDAYTNEEKIYVNDIALSKQRSTDLIVDDLLNKKKEKSFKRKEASKKGTVLIVEDNIDLRNFLIHTFSPLYNVISAENGKKAIEIALKKLPDLILSDIMMPICSGTEMCRTLKEDIKTKHIPIILLTARTANSIELDSYDCGADDFVSKPFDIEVLKAKASSLMTTKANIIDFARHKVLLNQDEISKNSADEEFFIKLSEYIKENIENPKLNVKQASEDLGLSRVHLYRKVRSITGKSPVEFIRDFKLSVAAELLEKDYYNINEICYKTGFQDISYFRKCFKKKYNVSASAYSSRLRQDVIN
jgi:ligand-binding sensor domain-containing protein/signal transduction histidine kinase/AraC-like DNA-binding protein